MRRLVPRYVCPVRIVKRDRETGEGAWGAGGGGWRGREKASKKDKRRDIWSE